MDFKDYYSALGVARDASDDDIRKAYRKLARKYHPDVSKEADADAKMRDINEARDVLQDKEKRAAYDQLADHVARGGSPDGGFRQPPPGWDEGYEFQRGPAQGPADHAEFSDSSRRSSATAAAWAAAAGRNARRTASAARITTPPSRSRSRTRCTAPSASSLRAQEIDDQGRPRLVDRTLDVRIPAGVRPGQYIRLAGQGLPGTAASPPATSTWRCASRRTRATASRATTST